MSNIWRRCPTGRISGDDLIRNVNIANEFFETVIYYGILKRWSGSAFVKEPLKVFMGENWQGKPLKRWSGTAWLQVDIVGK
jgi:hypothetical protein